MRSLSNFLESPIVEVNFAGFRSTTLALQREGWELSASESMSYHSYEKQIQLMLKYQNIIMVSSLNLMSHQSIRETQFGIGRPFAPFDICGISIDQNSYFIPKRIDPITIDFSGRSFSAIDAVPMMQQTIDLGAIDLSKWGVFRKLNDTANVFLPEKTVNELMAEILEKQKPMQQEIRERRMKKERYKDLFEIDRNPNEHIKLQLVAI